MNLLETEDILKFVGGLGVFLLAMKFIEEALIDLSGRRFKKFFREFTSTPFRGVISGTFATAILQSSSVVILIVLSFVGAGIIDMRSALGVVLGSNLGTTFTGWIVATFGFKFDIQNFAYPLIGVGTLLHTLLPKKMKLSKFCRFIAGLGLLFLGLEFMKSSMLSVSQQFDITALHGYGIITYFIFGFIFTAIIQSSSATMMITLAALNANILTLYGAAALVIGADLGTTTTGLLGSIGGKSEKKQTSIAHFSFNIVTDVVALIMLKPLLSLVLFVFGDQEPLLALVLFHSSFNLLGILVFLPFIGVFAKYLENYVGGSNLQLMKHLSKVSPQVPEAAVVALNKDITYLTDDIRDCNQLAFVLKTSKHSFESIYEQVKEKIGEMIEYILLVQEQEMSEENSKRLNQHLKALDHLSRSAKAAKDIHHDMKKFEKSARENIIEFQTVFLQSIQQMYKEIDEVTQFDNESHIFGEISRLMKQNNEFYEKHEKVIFEAIRNKNMSESDITTLLNVSREIHSSVKSLLLALKDILLSPEKAEEL